MTDKIYTYAEQTHDDLYGFVVTPLEHKFLGVANEDGSDLQTDSRVAKPGKKLVVETKFAAIDIDNVNQVLTFSTTDENLKADLTQSPYQFTDYEFHQAMNALKLYAIFYTIIHG